MSLNASAGCPSWRWSELACRPRVDCMVAARPPRSSRHLQRGRACVPFAAADVQALEAWFKGHSPASLLVPFLDDGGRLQGLRTEAAVAPGEVLLNVPRELLLTQQSAAASRHCGGLVGELTEWQALVLHLLCERADPHSPWSPYLHLLGNQVGHPLLWSAEQQAQLLNGSPMLPRLRARLQQVQEDATALVALGANDLAIGDPASVGPLVTPESVAWAATVLLARAFSLDMSNEDDGSEGGAMHQWGDVLALAPLADAARLTLRAGPCLEYDPDARAARLVADRAYAAGEEVFVACGAGLSASDMLLDWGHVLPGADGRCDVYPEDVAAPRGDRNRTLLAALGDLQGTGAQIALGASGPDVTSLTWVRAALASDADLMRSGWRLTGASARGGQAVEAACRAMGRLSVPTSATAEKAVLAAFEGFIRRRLGAFSGRPQPVAEDGLQANVEAALSSEAQALEGALAVVSSWQQQLHAGCDMEKLADLYSYSGHDGDDDWEDEED